MVVSPALQRGERGEQERPSPVGAAQISKFVVKIAFMRLPWSDGWEQVKSRDSSPERRPKSNQGLQFDSCNRPEKDVPIADE